MNSKLKQHFNGSCEVSETAVEYLNPFGDIEEPTGWYILNYLCILLITYCYHSILKETTCTQQTSFYIKYYFKMRPRNAVF